MQPGGNNGIPPKSLQVLEVINQIWLHLMELPAAKTVPLLLLLTPLNRALDLECLPLSLLSKWPGLGGGHSKAFRERFSLARLKTTLWPDIDVYHNML